MWSPLTDSVLRRTAQTVVPLSTSTKWRVLRLLRAPGPNRTDCLPVFSGTLYQVSYRGRTLWAVGYRPPHVWLFICQGTERRELPSRFRVRDSNSRRRCQRPSSCR